MASESNLELCFSSAWTADPEPDASAWSAGDPPLGELDEPGWDELEIPGFERADALQTDAWNLTTELRMIAAAALVPLLLTSTLAHATEPAETTAAPTMQQPAETTEAPTMQPAETCEAPTAQPAETTPAPSAAPAEDPGASIWDALIDRHVLLTSFDGTRVRGTVLSVTDGMLALAQDPNGLLVLVDPAGISTVHVQGLSGVPAQRGRPHDGQGLIVWGAIAVGIGSALALATVVVAADCLQEYGYLCPYMTLPLGITGAVNLAVGIPLLVTGKRNRKQFRAEQDAMKPQVSAFMGASADGAMGGVGIRF